MKSFFFDTSILIDFFADRQPFAESAAVLFSLALDKKVKIYCSAISFNNIYYLFRKIQSHKTTIKSLNELLAMSEIISLGSKILNQALQSDFRDFEDAIQYFSALSVSNLDAIVTRNTKDFRSGEIPLLTPTEVVGLLQ